VAPRSERDGSPGLSRISLVGVPYSLAGGVREVGVSEHLTRGSTSNCRLRRVWFLFLPLLHPYRVEAARVVIKNINFMQMKVRDSFKSKYSGEIRDTCQLQEITRFALIHGKLKATGM
jgi:hypothetical protein